MSDQFSCKVTMFADLLSRVTVLTNFLMVLVFFTPSISPIYRATVATPALIVYNVMACRVYRKVKLGAITDGTSGTFTSPYIPSQESSSFHFTHPAPISFTSSSVGAESGPTTHRQEPTTEAPFKDNVASQVIRPSHSQAS